MGCHPNTIWSLLKSGELKGFTLNRKRMIAVAELDEFMARGGTNQSTGMSTAAEPVALVSTVVPHGEAGTDA